MDVMAQQDNILMVTLKWSLREKNKSLFKKNTGRLFNLSQHSRMISRKAWNLLFYAQLNFVTRCAPAVCSVLCFRARWAIRNMVIACWAATHTLAATVATCGETTCYNTHIIYFIQGPCHWASSNIMSLGNICKDAVGSVISFCDCASTLSQDTFLYAYCVETIFPIISLKNVWNQKMFQSSTSWRA